jgi:hypothetical protein
MMREYQVRICERLGVKLPGPTRQNPLPSTMPGGDRTCSDSGRRLTPKHVWSIRTKLQIADRNDDALAIAEQIDV